MTFEEQRLDLIKRGEGSIRHMYLDTVGKVTVGVGNMLPTADRATELTFVDRATKRPATKAQIRKDFAAVKRQDPGRAAGAYRKFTSLDMPMDAIEKLLRRRISGFEGRLRKNFENYDRAPDEARLGLIDMAFNLGVAGVVNKFPSFTRAARAGDWAGCARECNRRGISDHRNEEVRALFRKAARSGAGRTRG